MASLIVYRKRPERSIKGGGGAQVAQQGGMAMVVGRHICEFDALNQQIVELPIDELFGVNQAAKDVKLFLRGLTDGDARPEDDPFFDGYGGFVQVVGVETGIIVGRCRNGFVQALEPRGQSIDIRRGGRGRAHGALLLELLLLLQFQHPLHSRRHAADAALREGRALESERRARRPSPPRLAWKMRRACL